jgi:LSD1 subclass zinc finger protein
MTNCPSCGNPLVRSDRLIPGAVVLRCSQCRTMAVQVDGVAPSEFILAGPGVVQRLERIADTMRRNREDITAEVLGPEWEFVQQ